MFGNEWIYSPMNRAAVYSLFCTGNQGNIPRNERKRIVDFHQRKDLIGEELCFVDFGFRATLPRIQQLMLIDEGYPVSPDNQMLLALQTQGGSIFDQKVRDDSFKMSKDELTGFDLQLKDNIRGFINEGIGGGGGSGLTLTALNGSGGSPHADMRFFSVLQELPSYIKETGEEAMLHPLKRTQRTASYTVGSTAEIVAKYAFMRGLMAADLTVPAEKEDAFEAINTFYALYRTYPDLYTLLEDFNKKCINDKRFTQEVVNLNSDLSQRGLQQIFT